MRPRLPSIALSVLLAGCGGVMFGGGPGDEGVVPVGPLGPVIEPPNGDGPPIECRGIARDRCGEVGTLQDGMGVDLDEVKRVIVSCIGLCTSAQGEFRTDLVIGDATLEFGRGAYGSLESQ
jgi:hypothetical protein